MADELNEVFNHTKKEVDDALKEVSEKFGRKNPPFLIIKKSDYPFAGMGLELKTFFNSIRITTGMIRRFSLPEIKAIFAHELNHLENKGVIIFKVFFISIYLLSGLNLLAYLKVSLLTGTASLFVLTVHVLWFVSMRFWFCRISISEEYRCDKKACEKTYCRDIIKALEKRKRLGETELINGQTIFGEKLEDYVRLALTWPWTTHPSDEDRIEVLKEYLE